MVWQKLMTANSGPDSSQAEALERLSCHCLGELGEERMHMSPRMRVATCHVQGPLGGGSNTERKVQRGKATLRFSPNVPGVSYSGLDKVAVLFLDFPLRL